MSNTGCWTKGICPTPGVGHGKYMTEFKVYAPAKLNLYLDIIDKRPDGYHNIETLFEKIDLKDEIVIKEASDGLRVHSTPAGKCPSGKDNIVYKALEALFSKAGRTLSLDVNIIKRVPVSAGLGGGSSDAASVLRSVNTAFGLGVSKEDIYSIACTLGKDVAFFLEDSPYAVGRGAGDELEALDTDFCLTHIIVNPRVGFSTAEMYDKIKDTGRDKGERSLEKASKALIKKDPTALKKNFYNRFESISGEHVSEIERGRKILEKAGADGVFLSGSGPSVFCVAEDEKDALNLRKKIVRDDIDIFLATTYKGGIYGNN